MRITSVLLPWLCLPLHIIAAFSAQCSTRTSTRSTRLGASNAELLKRIKKLRDSTNALWKDQKSANALLFEDIRFVEEKA
jgi:hypothetical protein